MDSTEIQRLLRDYVKQLHVNKMDNLEKNGQFLKKVHSSKTEPGRTRKYEQPSQKDWYWNCDLKPSIRDFPGGPVGKNPPANAEDTGLIPGPGRFRKPGDS